MKDMIVRGTAMDGAVRALATTTTVTMEQIRQLHDTWPTATASLGRAVTAGVLMGAMLKGEEKLTIQVKGNGPLGQIVVDANAKGEVRGFVDQPHTDLPDNAQGKLDVAGAVGTDGFIHIIKDLGLKEPYRGSIPIISGELAEDFTYYFAKSEQTPSAVALGVLVDVDSSVIAAGGFIIQLLPGITNEAIDEIEARIANLRPITEMLNEGRDPVQILKEVVPTFQLLEEMPVSFRCKCSRDRIDQTLISLGKQELEAMLREDGQAEVSCHFCNKTYTYNSEQLQALIDQ